MNFSEPLRVTAYQLHWSPDGKYCATAATARLEIKDGSTLQLIISFNCSEFIQNIEWSPDSSLVYTANFKRGIIEVWQPGNPAWRCKIDEGSVGLIKAKWSLDSRHLLTTAEFHLRVTVWSLVSKSVYYIKFPKEASPGLQFSHDGDYLAVAERIECKDFISIFETKSWTRVKNFEVSTRDLAGLAWSPDDSVLAVWDSPIEHKVLIYTITGQCLSSFSAYQLALGVKCVTWSPTAQFLAIGNYNQNICLLNHITWKLLFEFVHGTTVEDESCQIYKEKEVPLTGFPAALASVHGLPVSIETQYEAENTRPVRLGAIPVEMGIKANPKVGIGALEFSADGRYLASRVDNMPATVWVWNITKLSLAAVLVHCNPVRDMKWCPIRTRLAICTGGNNLYMWTPFGSVSVTIPKAPNSHICSLRWHPSGHSIAVIGKEEFSVCFLNSKAKEINNSEDNI